VISSYCCSQNDYYPLGSEDTVGDLNKTDSYNCGDIELEVKDSKQ
jgi:hypothetical protein